MKIKNGDLMTFHAVALSLREFCDVRTHLCLAKRSPLGSRRFLCAGAAGGGQAGLGWRYRGSMRSSSDGGGEKMYYFFFLLVEH